MTQSVLTPADYIRTYVEPNYQDYQNAQTNLRYAMNAATACYHMCDWMFVSYHTADPQKVFNQSKVDKYRDYLNQHHCLDRFSGQPENDLHILGDIVNGYKHLNLDRGKGQVSSAASLSAKPATWGGGTRWGDGTSWGGDFICVALDSGKNRNFQSVIENVFQMWQRLST